MKDWEEKFQTLSKQMPSSSSLSVAEPEAKAVKEPVSAPLALEVESEASSVAQIIGPVLWEEWQYFDGLDSLDVFAAEVNGYASD